MASFWSWMRPFAAKSTTRTTRRKKARPAPKRRYSPLTGFEKLEDRLVPTTDPLGVAADVSFASPLPGSTFVAAGPQQTGGGQTLVSGPSTVSGATTSIAINPLNSSILYVGTTNGGIWRTTNINATDTGGNNFPTWTPLTDSLATLSVTSLTFDVAATKAAYGTATTFDGSKDVIYAGTGNVGSANVAGPAVGLLKTTDGGQTWTVKGYDQFKDLKITSVVATQYRDAGGLHSVLLVGTRANGAFTLHGVVSEVGVWRSTDGGDTWARVTDPDGGTAVSGLMPGDVTDLKAVRDPAQPDSSLIYAGNIGKRGANADGTGAGLGVGAGIYESADGGQTWKNVTRKADNSSNIVGMANLQANSGGTYDLPTAQPFNIKLAVFASGTNANSNAVTRVYAGITTDAVLQRIIYWDRSPTNSWQSPLDTPGTLETTNNNNPLAPVTAFFPLQKSQANLHFSLAVDPTSVNKIFMGGSIQPVINQAAFPPNPATASSNNVSDFVGRLFRVDASQNFSAAITGNQARGDLLTGSFANNTAPHGDSRVIVFDSNGTMYEGDDGGIYRLVNPEAALGTDPAASPKWVSLNGNLQVTEVGNVTYDALNQEVTVAAQDTGVQHQTTPNGPAYESFQLGDGSVVQVGYVKDAGGNVTQTILYTLSNSFAGLNVRAYSAGNPTPINPNFPLLVGNFNQNRTGFADVDANTTLFPPPLAVNATNPAQIAMGYNKLYTSANYGGSFTFVDDTTGSGLNYFQDPMKPNNATYPIEALAYGGFNADGSAAPNVIYRSRAGVLRTFDGTSWGPEFLSGTNVTQIAVDPRNWKVAYATAKTGALLVTTDGGRTWTNVNDPTRGAAGLPQTSLRSAQLVPIDSPDLHFTLLNGDVFDVSLRGAVTINDIAQAIRKQTKNEVSATAQVTNGGQNVNFRLFDGTNGTGTFTVTAAGTSNALVELGFDVPADTPKQILTKVLKAPASTTRDSSLTVLTNALGGSGIHRSANDQDVLLVGGDAGLFRLSNPLGDPSVLGAYPAIPGTATQAQFQVKSAGANNDVLITANQNGPDVNGTTVSVATHSSTSVPARTSWDPVNQNLVFDMPATATANDLLTLVNGPNVTPATNPMTATDSATTGQLLKGTYQYKVSFVSPTGVEGNLSIPISVTVAADYHSVQLTNIPAGPAMTLARRIYRTSADSSSFDLVATINDNTPNATFTDFTPDRLQAAAPAVAAFATTATDGGAGGKLAAGTYLYRFSFVDTKGVESQLSAPVTAASVAANDVVNLANIPIGPGGTAARRIYRAGSTDTTYTLLASINDNTTATFTDRWGGPVDLTATSGRPAKPTGIAAAPQAGGRLAVGAYNYRVTLLDATGVESLASDVAMATTTAGNQSVTLTGIKAPAGTLVRIYRTQPGGTTYNLIATLNGTDGTTAIPFTDNGTFGFDPTAVTDGSRPSGSAVPNITGSSIPPSTTGSLAKGTYTYRVTFLDANGVESNQSAVTSVTVANDNSQVVLTIPVVSVAAKGRRIYRSSGPGSPYVLVGTINDNTATTFTDFGTARDLAAAAVNATFKASLLQGPAGDSTDGTGTFATVTSSPLTGGTASAAATATVTVAGDNNDLKVTAKSNGAAFNGAIAFINTGRNKGNEQITWNAANQVLVFDVSSITTANDIVAAMGRAQNAAASALFTVAPAAPDPASPNTGVGPIGNVTGLKRLPVPSLQWTEFGTNLPDALVTSVTYTPQLRAAAGNIGDVLVVGLRGRGAWELTGAAALLAQPSVLQINSNGDHLLLTLDPSRPAGLPQVLQVFQVNDGTGAKTLKGTFPLSGVQQIKITGTASNDKIDIDPRIRLVGGVVIDGGGGTDTLTVTTQPGQFLAQNTAAGSTGTLKVANATDLKDPGLKINFVNTSTVVATLPPALNALGAGDLKSQLAQVQNGLTYVASLGTLDDTLTAGLTSYPLIGSAISDLLLNNLGPKPVAPPADPGSGSPAADDGGDGGEGDGGIASANQPNSSILSLLLGIASKAFTPADIGTTITTMEGVRQALDALDTTANNVTLTQTADGFKFDVTVARTLTTTTNLSPGKGNVALTSNTAVTADVTLHLVFGVDKYGFFFDTTPGPGATPASAPEVTIANIKTTSNAVTSGRFGFLQVTAPTSTITIDPAVKFTADLMESDPDPFTTKADNLIRTGELFPTPSKLFTFTSTGPTNPVITVSGTFGAAPTAPGGAAPIALQGNINLKWSNINDLTTVTAAANGTDAASAAFLGFQNITAQSVINALTTVADDFQAKSQVDVLTSPNVPLTSRKLYDILNKDKATAVFQGADVAFAGGLTDDGTLQHFTIDFNNDLAPTTAQLGLKIGGTVQFAATNGTLVSGTIEGLDTYSVSINYASTDTRTPDQANPYFLFTRSGALADQLKASLGKLTDPLVQPTVLTLQDILARLAAAQGVDPVASPDQLPTVTVDTTGKTLTLTPTFEPTALFYDEQLDVTSSLSTLSFDPTAQLPITVSTTIHLPLQLSLTGPVTNDSAAVVIDNAPAVEYQVDVGVTSLNARSYAGAKLQVDASIPDNDGVQMNADYKLTAVDPGSPADGKATLTEMASILTNASKNLFTTAVQGNVFIDGLLVSPENTAANSSVTRVRVFTTNGTIKDVSAPALFNNLTDLTNINKKLFAKPVSVQGSLTQFFFGTQTFQFTFAPPSVAVTGVKVDATTGQATITGTSTFNALDLNAATVSIYYDTATTGFHGQLVARLPAAQAATFSVPFAGFSTLAPQPYFFYAVASDGVNPPVYSDYSAPATPNIPAGATDLAVTTSVLDMSGSPVTFVQPGDQVQIKITASNNGPVDATNVKVTGGLPNGVTFTSATTPGTTTYDSPSGVWTVGNLAKSTTSTLVLKGTVAATILTIPINELVSTAAIAGTQADYLSSNNQATATAAVAKLITVNNAADETNPTDNMVSLREAVLQANSDPNQVYLISLKTLPNPTTINLDMGVLPVTGNLILVGAGMSALTISGKGTSRIFDVQSSGSLSVSGMTLTNGASTGTNSGGAIQNAGGVSLTQVVIQNSKSNNDGGAIYNTGSLTLNTVTLTGNTATANGGAISSKGGSVILVNSTVGGDTVAAGNTATLSGGGLYLSLDVNDSITGGAIKNNKAPGTGKVAYGGGVLVKNGRLTVTGATIANNSAPVGGGLEVFSSDPKNPAVINLIGDTVTGNQATGNNTDNTNRAGALAIYNGSLVQADTTTFSGNSASNGGVAKDNSKAGAVYVGLGSTLIVTRSTFSGNSAPRQSGAIDVAGTLLATESTFFNNTTPGFGGAIDTKGRVTLKSDTFSKNTAAGGGGIAVFGTTTANGTLYIGSTVVAGNTGGTAPDVSPFTGKSGAVVSLGYNLIGVGDTTIAWQATTDQLGTAKKPLDPKLATTLALNGGTTQNLLPQTGSPLINKGNPNPGDATDQRGLARVVGTASDIGSVEVTAVGTAGATSVALDGGGDPTPPAAVAADGGGAPAADPVPPQSTGPGTITPATGPDFTEQTVGTLSASFVDPGSSAAPSDYTVTVDWGDHSTSTGSPDVTVTGSSGNYTITGTHTYADEGSFTVAITIVNNVTTATSTETLTEVADDLDTLTIDPNTPGTQHGVEGTALGNIVLAVFDDAGNPGATASDFSASIAWGDKATTAGTITLDTSGSAPVFKVMGSHLYTEDDTYAVTVTITDPPTGQTLVIPLSIVADEDPAFAATAAPTITTVDGTAHGVPLIEGAQMTNIVLATFQHANGAEAAGSFVASIDWGDGSSSDNTGTVTLVVPTGGGSTPFYEVLGSHVYAEDRTWPIAITIQDTQDTEIEPNSPPVTVTATAVVGEDPTFTATGGQTLNAGAGQYLSSVKLATFQHSDGWEDPTKDFQVTIDWGDGTPGSDPSATGQVQEDNNTGIYTVFGSHAYATPSGATPYKLTVTITDISGTDDLAASPAIQKVVSDDTAAVTQEALGQGTGAPVSGFEFSPLAAVPVATFTGPAPGGTTASIDWGDGVTTPGTIVGTTASFGVQGSHVYHDEGTYNVSVTVADSATSTAVATTATIQEELLPDGSRGTPTQRFVSELYRDLLGRPVDAKGLADATSALAQGMSQAGLVLAIEGSDEYHLDEVNALYEKYLNRPADPASDSGVMSHVVFLRSGTVEQLATVIVSSAEYFQVRGGGTNDGFVTALANDALGRSFSGTDQANLDAALAAGASRAQIAASLFASDEYHQDVVRGIYLHFLDRPADAPGLRFWSGALDLGFSDDLITALIIGDGGQEFFHKTSS